MRLSYPQSEYSRGQAWRELLDHKPKWPADDPKVEPLDHHFCKDHEADEWRWYVQKWRCLGEQLSEPPCDPPPPVVIANKWTHEYQWSEWTEYDGTRSTGFVIVDWPIHIEETV